MIVQKEFKGNAKGRARKYDFSNLTPGSCLVINPNKDIAKQRHKISTSLYQWKKYNSMNWETAVRIEDGKIYVYRIK